MKGFTSANLSDRILRMIHPEDRAKLPKGLMTQEEALAKATAKSERELQNLIGSLLSLKGIKYFRSRMDKKTTNDVGTPDFLFAIDQGLVKIYTTDGPKPRHLTDAIGWEVKLPGEKLRPEQEKVRDEMQRLPNGWSHKVITSVDQAILELRELGIR